MPIYLVQDPINHDQVRYEVGSEIELTLDLAAILPVSGPIGGSEQPIVEDTPEPEAEPEAEEASSLINVNTSSIEELTAISGLGDAIAAAIVDLRPIDDLAILSEIPRFRDSWLELLEV